MLRSLINSLCTNLFSFFSSTPEGAEDVSKYPVLFAALLESDDVEWTEEDLAKLASKNLIRVFKEVEAIRRQL